MKTSYNNELTNAMKQDYDISHTSFLITHFGRDVIDILKHEYPYHLITSILINSKLEDVTHNNQWCGPSK